MKSAAQTALVPPLLPPPVADAPPPPPVALPPPPPEDIKLIPPTVDMTLDPALALALPPAPPLELPPLLLIDVDMDIYTDMEGVPLVEQGDDELRMVVRVVSTRVGIEVGEDMATDVTAEDIEDEYCGGGGAADDIPAAADDDPDPDPDPDPLTIEPVKLSIPTFPSANSEKCPPTTGLALKKIGPGETGYEPSSIVS